MKQIRYFLEAILLHSLFLFFKALPPKSASNIGGWIGRTIGYRLATNRKARRHVLIAFPEITKNEQDKIILGMWNNLGRVIAEYPHLQRIGKEYTSIENQEELRSYINDERAVIFIGGHIANWEVNSAATLMQLNHAVKLTYRAPNNPWTDKLLEKARTMGGKLKAFPKSRKSGRFLIETLKQGGSLGILIDQKYNEGIEVDFFGMPSMTNPVFVQLAQKYNAILVPIKCERKNGCDFNLKTYPPIDLFNDSGVARDTKDVIKEAHTMLEGWIKEKPEQWLWLHRRWKY